jgi:hypothetical protein
MAKKLNDTQRTVLAAAAARGNLHALPLPDTLRAPAVAVTKTIGGLIAEGLVAEIAAAPEDAVWRQDGEGGKTTLVITEAGLAAIGIVAMGAVPATSPTKPSTGVKRRAGGAKPAGRVKAAPQPTVAPTGAKLSKQDAIIGLLRRGNGASVAEMQEVTGWAPHSVRGFMSGALKKRLGLPVVSVKTEAGERRYHLAVIKHTDPS